MQNRWFKPRNKTKIIYQHEIGVEIPKLIGLVHNGGILSSLYPPKLKKFWNQKRAKKEG